jgi:carbamoyltransferase
LIVDGKIVAAAQEERFTRKKHDSDFPTQAVHYCLDAAGVAPENLDYVGFYEKPLARFDRLLETYFGVAPGGFGSFMKAIPQWLKTKLYLPREMDRGLDGRYRGPYVFCEHHESHAASAFLASPVEEAAILTRDGVGEWATGSYGYGRGNGITLTHELRFPHSVGLLYSAFTYYTGFKVNSGEYKVMGLAPYGEPRFAQLILDHLVDLKEDGSLRMDMRYFNYCQGLTMTSPRFHRLFGAPPRRSDDPLTQREMDLAASVQKVTEEIMLRAGRHVHKQTGIDKLVLAGGVALNCVGNGRLLREGPFDDIWIQPAAGDAGGALGVALLIWHQILGNDRVANGKDIMNGSYLGPSFSDAEIRELLDSMGVPYEHLEDDAELVRAVAEELEQQKVVGWFRGRMEFGPRALGSRSILGDPRDPATQSVMNLKIKYRESFRPFAPVVLEDRCGEYFDLDRPSPYMLLVAPVARSQRRKLDEEETRRTGIDRLRLVRSTIPAVTHVDYSARIQTVGPDTNPTLHALLAEFDARTGCPVLVNTSFNVRGEPIVCTPRDAYNCFLRTQMDCLVLGNFVLRKEQQRALRMGRESSVRGVWEAVGAAPVGYHLDD